MVLEHTDRNGELPTGSSQNRHNSERLLLVHVHGVTAEPTKNLWSLYMYMYMYFFPLKITNSLSI